jgi:hypothetical protein
MNVARQAIFREDDQRGVRLADMFFHNTLVKAVGPDPCLCLCIISRAEKANIVRVPYYLLILTLCILQSLERICRLLKSGFQRTDCLMPCHFECFATQTRDSKLVSPKSGPFQVIIQNSKYFGLCAIIRLGSRVLFIQVAKSEVPKKPD